MWSVKLVPNPGAAKTSAISASLLTEVERSVLI
jgi:hypothetical protein